MSDTSETPVPTDGQIGPVEYLVLDFEGNRFGEEVLPEIGRIMESGMIRIIDMAAVCKQPDGGVTIYEIRELSEELASALVTLTGSVSGLLSEADLMDLADAIPAGTTAVALLFEHVWAKDIAETVRRAGGQMVYSTRIPNDVVHAARETLIAAAR